MPKDIFPKVEKKVEEIKHQASKATQEAIKTADTVKQAVEAGIGTSKSVLQRMGGVISKDKLSRSLDATSKGIDFVAKGARIASKGADALANTIEKTSEKVKEAGNKFRK